MRYNSAPVSTLFVKLVAQKRNGEVLAYTLLASDQQKVTQRNAVYAQSFTADFDFSNVAQYAENMRQQLNFATVEIL